MAVDHALWDERFDHQLPPWTCPTCARGTLRLKGDAWNELETGPSAANRAHEAWEPEWLEYRFTGMLECQNGDCGELVAIAGTRTVDVFQTDYDDYDEVKHYSPTHLFPAPPVFIIPADCPDTVTTELRQAFSLLWQDSGSAANRLRVAVEALLTDKGIARNGVRNGRRFSLSLHTRIERFRVVHEAAAGHLMAIKWLGNTGSHAGLDVSRSSLIQGFELFEHVLDLLYVRTAERLRRIAKIMTARKGRGA